MHRAVSTVYANIIKFLQRVMNWYSEGRIKHIVSSILRPYELRFKDLVDEIARCSRGVDQLAFMASQVELRNMHVEQKEMHMTVLDLKRTVAENQALNYRSFLEFKRRICEIQFSQILSFTATTSLMSSILPIPQPSASAANYLRTKSVLAFPEVARMGIFRHILHDSSKRELASSI